jgi:hypothetical protein
VETVFHPCTSNPYALTTWEALHLDRAVILGFQIGGWIGACRGLLIEMLTNSATRPQTNPLDRSNHSAITSYSHNLINFKEGFIILIKAMVVITILHSALEWAVDGSHANFIDLWKEDGLNRWRWQKQW